MNTFIKSWLSLYLNLLKNMFCERPLIEDEYWEILKQIKNHFMTNEQAAAEYADKNGHEIYGVKTAQLLEDAFLEGCAHAEPKWISVEDALPKPHKDILMWNDYISDYRTGIIDGNGYFYEKKKGVLTAQQPSHWQYITPPQP